VRVRKPDEAPGEGDALDDADEPAGNFLFKLPAPPSPYKDKLGDPEVGQCRLILSNPI
jgi:hypothetical protein